MENKAFTLTELLGVIVIIAILSLVMMPAIINQVRNGEHETDGISTEILYAACEQYVNDKPNEYPDVNGTIYYIPMIDLIYENYISQDYIDSLDDIDQFNYIKVTMGVNNNKSYLITDTN
jgi:prepilin-type N-terminal cleavage/methylation domain-containing protein